MLYLYLTQAGVKEGSSSRQARVKEVFSIETAVIEVDERLEPIPEAGLPHLMSRYKVSRQTIHTWRRFLGFKTKGSKHFYDPQEILELDYFFAAAFVPKGRKRSHWGLCMGRRQYEQKVLDKGISFDQYLRENYGIDFKEFIKRKELQWQEKLFGN